MYPIYTHGLPYQYLRTRINSSKQKAHDLICKQPRKGAEQKTVISLLNQARGCLLSIYVKRSKSQVASTKQHPAKSVNISIYIASLNVFRKRLFINTEQPFYNSVKTCTRRCGGPITRDGALFDKQSGSRHSSIPITLSSLPFFFVSVPLLYFFFFRCLSSR